MKIAICDDDPVELQRIRNAADLYARSTQHGREITVAAFTGGEDLLRCVKKQGGFDLILLDILMPGRNGIELARMIRENGDDCRILFLTSSPEYAVDSYRVGAFYYLLKPFSEAELLSLIDRALQNSEDERNSSVVVKCRGKITRLRLGAIRYVESINHNVVFHLRDGGLIDCFGSMTEFHDALLSDRRFIKCHKSFIVNMDCVAGIDGKEFNLDGGTRVPISRNICQQVKGAYFDYFFDKRSSR